MGRILLLVLILAGCNDRRSFDERYEDTQRELEHRAKKLDTAIEVAGNDSAANVADR